MTTDLLPGEGLIYLPLDDITEGDRVRIDLGNIKELADSIAAVGLLHPIVITPKRRLVAGGRRLSAVRSLGWSEVPVRVVDITTAERALRAESDENTCRKGLTPYEASDMRRRQAEVLAPIAAKNTGGRPRVAETGSNLEPVIERPSVGKVRKTAAIGTGYSGSTLDKVDRIRDAAERGVIRKGRTEVPAPAPVVEVAKKALEIIKNPAGRIDRAVKAVDQAVEQFVAEDLELVRVRYMKRFWSAMEKVSEVAQFDPAATASHMSPEDATQFDSAVGTFIRWADAVRAARPNTLRAIQGGRP